MIGKSFAIFAIVSYVHMLICTIDGMAVNAKKFELLKNDTQLCPTGKKFFDSRNAKVCQNMTFPVDNETLSETNEQQFLCVGLLVRASRVCYMGSLLQLPKDALPENMDAFDAKVGTSFLNSTTDVLTFCQNWKHTDLPSGEKTLLYSKQLDRVLKEVSTCVKMCAKFEAQLEPLCAVLASIDGIIGKRTVAVDKSGQGSKDGKAKVGTENEVQPEKAQDKVNMEEPKNSTNGRQKENAEVPKTVEERTSDGINGVPRTAAKVSGSEVNSSSSMMTNGTTSMQQKPSEVQTKKSDVGDVAQQSQVKTNPKVGDDKGEKLGKEGQKVASLPNGSNTKDTLVKNSRVKEPQADGDQPLLRKDNSVEATDEPIDDNADFISEHTQNDDQPAGGRVPSEDGEIESPIIPASDEDLNETPAQASVKHGYVPGMRGIRDDDDSHVFGYFTVIGVICIAGYVGYHNKQKILAMMLEGRRSRGGRGRRRPSTANYRKLDCTLEEAVTSQCTSNVTHVIY